MHICPFVRFMHAIICKTLFCNGVYNPNCVRSIVTASDLKGLWRLRHHSRLCWHNFAMIAKTVSECHSSIYLVHSSIFFRNLDWYLSTSVLWRSSPGNIWARKLCNDPRIIRSSFVDYLPISYSMCHHDSRLGIFSMPHQIFFSKLLLLQS